MPPTQGAYERTFGEPAGNGQPPHTPRRTIPSDNRYTFGKSQQGYDPPDADDSSSSSDSESSHRKTPQNRQTPRDGGPPSGRPPPGGGGPPGGNGPPSGGPPRGPFRTPFNNMGWPFNGQPYPAFGQQPPNQPRGGLPPGGPPGGGGPPRGGLPPLPPRGPRAQPQAQTRAFTISPYHFDPKSKADDIPFRDGNTETLMKWFKRVQEIANRSPYCFQQLGLLAPTRIKGRGAVWFNFISQQYKDRITVNWDTLKTAIATHFLNIHWYNQMKTKALGARYRQDGYSRERPTDYFYKKLELLQSVHDWTDAELIQEILDGAPDYWRTIINTTDLHELGRLQDAIMLHEHTLLWDPSADISSLSRRIRELERSRGSRNRSHQAIANEVETEELLAEANAIGAHPSIKPAHPPADNIVSKGQTPGQKGARPCRHCGSKNHWDYDCPHSDYQKKKRAFKVKFKGKGKRRFKGGARRKAQTNFIGIEPDAYEAFAAYEIAYIEATEEAPDSSSESEEEEDSNSDSDFENPEDFH
jgi:hypothetical protein